MQIAPVDTGAIGMRNTPRPDAGAMGQEIPHLLGRGAVAAAVLIRFALNGLLPVHAAQRPRLREVVRMHRHQQRRIGIFPVPPLVTTPPSSLAAATT